MIISMWHLVEISEEIAVYAYGNLYFVCIFFFANFGQFRKIKYTQKFLLNGIREKKYTLNMHKIYISQK